MPAWPVRRGALLGGVLALAACAAAILLPLRVCLWLLGGLFFGGILSLLLSGSRRTVPLFCCLAAALFLAAGLWQRTTRADPVEALAGGEDTICGQVIACPRSGRYYTVAVTAAGQVPAGTRLLLYCPDIAAPALYEEITAAVRLCALPSALAYQRANGVFLTAMPTGYGEQAITITGQTGRPPLRDRLRPLRLRLTKQLRQLLPGDEGGLLAAMCLGERSGLDTAATADFRRCGLSHLLAVSGLHLSAIAGGIWLLLGTLRLRPQIAAAATLLCSGLFAWLVGFTPSVSRAFCTACVLLSGQFFRRQADGLNSLGLALTLLLIIDPYTLYDVGFWLSFGATAGILTVTPALQRQWLPRGAILHRSRWLRLRRAVLSSLSVTLGATLPTLPLLVWLYREVAWLSPLTNLLLVPLAGALLFLGCGGLLLSALPLVGGLAHPLLLAAGGAARILLWCAALPGRLHTGTLGVNTTWLAVWITAAATVTTVLLIRKKQRTLHRLLPLLGVILAVLCLTDRHLQTGRTVVQVQTGQATVLVIENAGRSAVLAQQAADLPQVLYSLPGTPQVVAVGSGDTTEAAAVLRAAGNGAHILGPDTAGWRCGLPQTPAMAAGQPETLWPGCTLAAQPDGSWILQVQDSRLTLGTQKTAAGDEMGLAISCQTVYNGAATQTQTLCATPDGRQRALSANMTCRLTTRGTGEWSFAR